MKTRKHATIWLEEDGSLKYVSIGWFADEMEIQLTIDQRIEVMQVINDEWEKVEIEVKKA